MTINSTIIECCALAPSRNGLIIAEPVSFHLDSGAYVQLRGPNGCGKSTLLRHLAGLLPAERGDVLIDDTSCPPHLIAQRRLIGYLGHADALHGDLTGYENFELLTGQSRDLLVQLPLYERPTATYSAGQRQKLTLHMLDDTHDIWLLDEPSASLDDANLLYLEERIAGYLACGGAVVASTHTPLATSLVSQTITLSALTSSGITGQLRPDEWS